MKTQPKPRPLFEFDEDDDMPVVQYQAEEEYSDDDPELALAIQESLDQGTHKNVRPRSVSGTQIPLSPGVSKRNLDQDSRVDNDDDIDIYASPTRLETALAIAGAGPSPRRLSSSSPSVFGRPTLLTGIRSGSSSQAVRNVSNSPAVRLQTRDVSPSPVPVPLPPLGIPPVRENAHLDGDAAMLSASSNSDDDMEEILPTSAENVLTLPEATRPRLRLTPHADPTPTQNDSDLEVEMDEMGYHPVIQSQAVGVDSQQHTASSQVPTLTSRPRSSTSRQQDASPAKDYNSIRTTATADRRETSIPLDLLSADRAVQSALVPQPHEDDPESEGGSDAISDWSRSPSPVIGLAQKENVANGESSAAHENWDAAQEMDPRAEEGEFARFVSQVKGRDLDDVRAEIDQEIKSLHQQKKAAMRDSDDITQQMISQIMVCQFVIPF